MKKVITIIVVVVILVGMLIIAAINGVNNGFGTNNEVEVTVKTLEAGSISSSITVSGSVEAKKEQLVNLPVNAKITKVNVKKGQLVKKGDILFEVDLSDMNASLDDLEISEAIAQIRLEQLTSSSATSSSASARLAVDLAQMELDSARKAYEKQLENVAKNEALLTSGIISQEEFDAVEAAVADYEAIIKNAEVGLKQSNENLNAIYEANNDLASSNSYEREIQLLNMQSTRNAIDQLKNEITEIQNLAIADFDGVVIDMNIEAGETAFAGNGLMTIVSNKSLDILANVREYDSRNLELGQEVTIQGDGIDKSAVVKGEISYVAPVVSITVVGERQVKGVDIEIEVTEGVDFLKPGFSVECDIVTSAKEGIPVVSFDMLSLNENDEDIIYVVNNDNVIEERILELGATSNFDAEVISGVSVGELVVIDPNYLVDDGSDAIIIEDLSIESSNTEEVGN